MTPCLAPMAWTMFAIKHPEQVGAARETLAMKWTPDLGRLLGRVNAKVNGDIVSDDSTVNREWMLAPERGCCHDYAVTKRMYLMSEGWPASCLLLAEVHRVEDGVVDHLVLVCRTSHGGVILDNLTVALMNWPRPDYKLVRMQSIQDPNIWENN